MPNNQIAINQTAEGIKVYNKKEATQYWEECNHNFQQFCKTQHNQKLLPAGGMEMRLMIRHINQLQYNPTEQSFTTPSATQKFQFHQTQQPRRKKVL